MVSLGFGDGRMSFTSNGRRVALPLKTEWRHTEIWDPSQWKFLRRHPEYLIVKLGGIGVFQRGGTTGFVFPLVGFLSIWLAAGIYGELKLLKYPFSMPEGVPDLLVGSRSQIATLGGAMIALCSMVAIAEWTKRRANEAAACTGRIENIESYLGFLKMAPGEPIRWDLVRGANFGGGEIRLECVSGDSYVLSTKKPPKGEFAARCRCEYHRRYLEREYAAD